MRTIPFSQILVMAILGVVLLTGTCTNNSNINPLNVSQSTFQNPDTLLAFDSFNASDSFYEDMGTYLLVGGDILLIKNDPEHSRIIDALSGALTKRTGQRRMMVSLWPDGEIPYTLNGFTDNELKIIRSAMDSIQQICKVTYTQVSSNGNYVYKISKITSTTIGGQSTLGYSSTSFCDLSQIAWGVCVHEFLHGLGIDHEHQRADRDSFVTVNLANVMTSYKSQLSIIPLTTSYIDYNTGNTITTENAHLYTPYDYESIMHYPSTAFSSNGKPTIVPKAAGVTIGQRTYLSFDDKETMAMLYGGSNWVYTNKKPTVKFSSPVNNSNYKVGDTVIITTVPYDTDGTVKSVKLYNNASLLTTLTASPYTYVLKGLSIGAYQISAVAYDNFDSASASSNVTVTVVTNLPPTVTLTAPKSNYVSKINGSVTLSATAKDPDGKIRSVKFYNGNQLLGTDTTSPYSYTWSAVPEGEYQLTAVATDNSSGTTTSLAATLIVRNKVPTIKITAPANNSICKLVGENKLTVAVKDSDGTVKSVRYYCDDQLLSTVTVSPFSYGWSCSAAGTHVLKAVATDNNDDTAVSEEKTVTVRNKLPTIKISSPAANSVCRLLGPTVISTAASDSDGTVKNVQFFANNVLLGTVFKSPFNYTWTGASTGTYTLKAIVTDDNDVSVTSQTVTVTVRNKLPKIKITSPAANGVCKLNGPTVIKTAAADSDGTVKSVQFYMNNTLLGTVTSSPFNYTWTGASAGIYTLKAIVTDNNDASVTSQTIAVMVKNKLPVIAITSPAANGICRINGPTLIKTVASDSDGTVKSVKFYQNNVLLGTDTISPFSYTWTNMSAGTYGLKAIATDDNGASVTSSTISVTVRNKLPTVKISSPANNAGYTAGTIVSIAVAASDSDGTVKSVQLYQNNSLIRTFTQKPYKYSWITTSAGTCSFKAIVTDNDNASVTSGSISVIIR